MNRTEKVSALFDSKSSSWTEKYSTDLNYRLQTFGNALSSNVDRSAKVADLGCGSGPLLRYLHSFGYELSGIDVSPKMVEAANRELACEGIDITVLCGGLDVAATKLGPQDAIVCSSVVEYMENLELTMNAISNCLSAGGVAIVSLPNNKSPIRLFERLLGYLPLEKYIASEKLSSYMTYLRLSKTRPTHSEFITASLRSGLELVGTEYMNKKRALRFFGKRISATMLLYILRKV